MHNEYCDLTNYRFAKEKKKEEKKKKEKIIINYIQKLIQSCTKYYFWKIKIIELEISQEWIMCFILSDALR